MRLGLTWRTTGFYLAIRLRLLCGLHLRLTIFERNKLPTRIK